MFIIQNKQTVLSNGVQLSNDKKIKDIEPDGYKYLSTLKYDRIKGN